MFWEHVSSSQKPFWCSCFSTRYLQAFRRWNLSLQQVKLKSLWSVWNSVTHLKLTEERSEVLVSSCGAVCWTIIFRNVILLKFKPIAIEFYKWTKEWVKPPKLNVTKLRQKIEVLLCCHGSKFQKYQSSTKQKVLTINNSVETEWHHQDLHSSTARDKWAAWDSFNYHALRALQPPPPIWTKVLSLPSPFL